MKIGRENFCSLLCDVRQHVHHQSGPQRFGHPAVPLQGVRGAPGAGGQRSSHRPGAQGHDPASGRVRAPEPAGGRACLWRGATDRGQVARKKAEDLPPLSETLLPAQKGDVLELDELWSFAGSKVNPRWVWVALCRQTRQVVAYFVGDRSADSARALRARIPPGYPLPRHAQRLLAGLRRSLSPAHAPLHGQAGGRNLPCRALEQHPAPARGPLRAQNALLLQVRPDARSGFALVRPPLQPFTRSLTTTL